MDKCGSEQKQSHARQAKETCTPPSRPGQRWRLAQVGEQTYTPRESAAMPLPRPRRDRPWNIFDRWLRNHLLIKSIQRKLATVALYGVVRKVDRTKPRQHMQLTRGGKTGDGEDAFDSWEDCSFLEQQGFSAGVPIGARGLVLKPGGCPEYTCGLGMSKATERPTFLEPSEVTVWTPFASRLLADAAGSITLATDLEDYRDSRDDNDVGAVVRIKAGGVTGHVETFGEAEVRQRAQPAGGPGPVASSKLEATGASTFQVDDGSGVTATITMVAGEVVIENSAGAKAELLADGRIRLTPADGKDLELGGSAGLQALALYTGLKAQVDAIIFSGEKHTHAGDGLPPTLAPGIIPIPTFDFASSNTKAVG